MADWPKIVKFLSKNQNFDHKHKIPKNQWEKLNRYYYCQILKFWFFESALLWLDWFQANLPSVWYFFFAKSLKKNCLRQVLNIFIFQPYEFENLGFLINACRVLWGQKLNWVLQELKTVGLDHKKSNSEKSLGTLKL